MREDDYRVLDKNELAFGEGARSEHSQTFRFSLFYVERGLGGRKDCGKRMGWKQGYHAWVEKRTNYSGAGATTRLDGYRVHCVW